MTTRAKDSVTSFEVAPHPPALYGKNPDFPKFFTEPIPEGIAVRVVSGVAWGGLQWIDLQVVFEAGHPERTVARVTQSYLAGEDNRVQKLYNQRGLSPESVAVFFRLSGLSAVDWKILDVPFPVTERT